MTIVREGGNGNNGYHSVGRVDLGSRAGPGDSPRAHPRNAGITSQAVCTVLSAERRGPPMCCRLDCSSRSRTCDP